MSADTMQTFVMQQATWKNSSFSIKLDGAPFAEFHAPPMKWEGSFEADGRTYHVRTKSMFSNAARLEANDKSELATGKSGGMFSSSYSITVGADTFEIKPAPGAALGYNISRAGAQIGQGQGTAYSSSNGKVTLPPEMPLEAKLLLFWFLGRRWRSAKDPSQQDISN